MSIQFNKNSVQYDHIDNEGFYVIENYDKKTTFSSFMSAISGVKGIPMWSFYVNRGQVMSSIGIGDKNNSIMEFFPANEAYKRIYTNGFRTLIKFKNLEKSIYEPFKLSTDVNIERRLKIKNNEIKLEEINYNLNIKIEIIYFTIPNEDFAALARKVKIENLSEEELDIEIVDGLTSILPYGTDYQSLKNMSNTLMSYMEAQYSDGVVKYSMRTSTLDSTEVNSVDRNYFYLGFDNKEKLLNVVIDPEKIFGYDTTLTEPIEFIENSIEDITGDYAKCNNKIPSAFSTKKDIVKPNDCTNIYSYIGFARNNINVNDEIGNKCNEEYFENKRNEANEIINQITDYVNTKTSYPMFDEYIKQCYVDNVLRGGYPLEIGNKNKKIYYVYSRKHGDLERDYNFFSIEPNYYSQGNSNFRDVNQNRRMDVYIHPFIGIENIKLFMNFIQLDGYNPLVIKGKKFEMKNLEKTRIILKLLDSDCEREIFKMLNKEYTLGELYSTIENIKELDSNIKEVLLNTIIDDSEESIDADFGEGFWIDHWTYNLDLIEEYINIYPDKIKELLIEDNSYKYYNSPEYVLPRKERYTLNKNQNVRQYFALKKKENNNINKWIYDNDGNVFSTNLISKLFILAGIKFMSMDTLGIGIEMEAGKPGWNDAMNGLPGLTGSSTAELFELKRMLIFIKEFCYIAEEIIVPIEFYEAIIKVNKTLLEKFNYIINELEYWDEISDIKEKYREVTRDSVCGKKESLSKKEVERLLDNMLRKVNSGINKLKSTNKEIIPTFMYYDVCEYFKINNVNGDYVVPRKFTVNYLPSFLEGPTRYLKTDINLEEKRNIYRAIKNSGIYDEKLKMYKTSESLEDITFEIGRARGFTAGWLERESIFMHMEYKYILALLKGGLYEEFYEEIYNILPPFMNQEVYGRSILENSSFIASSVNPNERIHGKGFVARLSGTTVEMLNIWKIMMVGNKLFTYEDNNLSFNLSPILAKELFDKNDVITTTLLGNIELKYINENRKNTFGDDGVKVNEIKITLSSGKEININGNKVIGSVANDIRSGKVRKIEAKLI